MAENSRKNEHFELGRIAIIAKGANLTLPAGKLIFSLYYPAILGICLLLSILLQKKNSSSGEIKA